MDRRGGILATRFAQNPVFATLDSAIADAPSGRQRSDLVHYRDRCFEICARQALRQGESEVARTYLGAMSQDSDVQVYGLRLLSFLPGRLVRSALDMRSVVRRSVGMVRKWA
jgi:hypothetical protein